jgi:hypothetical protein
MMRILLSEDQLRDIVNEWLDKNLPAFEADEMNFAFHNDDTVEVIVLGAIAPKE